MTRAFIGLGSNLQDPVTQVTLAIQNLENLPNSQFIQSSSLYASKPQGPEDQPDFVNAVAEIETQLSPLALLDALQAQEKCQGKVKVRHWGERLIDLDILLFGNESIQSERLQVPHLALTQRDFVLLPLAEIAPDVLIPGQAKLASLIENLTEQYVYSLPV